MSIHIIGEHSKNREAPAKSGVGSQLGESVGKLASFSIQTGGFHQPVETHGCFVVFEGCELHFLIFWSSQQINRQEFVEVWAGKETDSLLYLHIRKMQNVFLNSEEEEEKKKKKKKRKKERKKEMPQLYFIKVSTVDKIYTAVEK